MNKDASIKMNDLPKKPLSAYNLFFQYHRIKILQAPEGSDSISDEADGLPGLEGVDPSSPLLSKPEAEIRKFRKEVIDRALKENPFRINNEKRSHVKTHGKMSFLEMSKHMGRKWKEADEGTRSIFRQLANEGKAKFNKTVCESYKAACNKFCSKSVVQQPSVAFITPRVPLPPEFSTDKAVSSPNVMLSPYHSQLGVGELHNMLQNVEWTSGEYAQNSNNGNLYELKNPLKQAHQQVRGYNDVQGMQRLQYVNPVLNNGAKTVAAKDLVDRPYSLVDKRDEMNDDEFRRLLNQLDWSRLEGSKGEN